MNIVPGSKLGPYEVTALLGEGGMGVVFRGRDSRLNRDVALKLLPDHFAGNPDRLARFQREAQLLASLNHPNIAQIFGLEGVNGSTCIVMELVEGETLSERLKKGPMPFDEAVAIARQIADALAAAHERGIVHRDLKPANIKLTPNGTVKVLDFGLAKALGSPQDPSLSAMPTRISGSMVGSVVGTPGYMSPEQARGKEVDARSDIWAFGCVLYEMLTARQAFEGETTTDVVARIVTGQPDLNLLPPDTPTSIRRLLSATLTKNAPQRLQHIGDSRLFFDGPLAAGVEAAASEAPKSSGLRKNLVTAALVAALAVVAVPAMLYFRSSAPAAGAMYFQMTFPDIVGGAVAVSPDGRSIAYAAQPADGRRAVWIRSVGSETAQPVRGTDNVNAMVWSPDSRRLLIQADGKLKKIDVAGGTIQTLSDFAGGHRGFAWGSDGVILIARTSDNIIVRMQDTGGEMTPVTKLNSSTKELVQGLPVFLPDGKQFLYVAVGDAAGIFLGSLDSEVPPKLVLALNPQRFNGLAYTASGHVMYLEAGRLIAQRLDVSAAKLVGDPVTLAEDLAGTFSVSNDGLLFFRRAAPVVNRQLQWFDSKGNSVGRVGEEANYGGVELSPDGGRAAVDITSANNGDIWVMDLARSVPSRITFDPARDWTAFWSPDGKRLVFASDGRKDQTSTGIYQKSSSGVGADELISIADFTAIPVHWSPDGKYIVLSRAKPNSNVATYDTFLASPSGEPRAVPYVESPFDKLHARVSPNGKWMAYSTNESGMYQIVVQTFPDPNGGKWQISAEGGVEPKWSRDSRELYYLGFDGRMMSVTLTGESALTASRPTALFQTPLTVNRSVPNRTRRYDVAPDGRFLIAVPASEPAAAPFTVVVNSTSSLDE